MALGHDVVIILGLFSIFAWDFDLTVLAALLAVIGYSLNDTIVVSDRIRENFRTERVMEPEEMTDLSLNQTLGKNRSYFINYFIGSICSIYIWWGDDQRL